MAADRHCQQMVNLAAAGGKSVHLSCLKVSPETFALDPPGDCDCSPVSHSSTSSALISTHINEFIELPGTPVSVDFSFRIDPS